MKLDVGIGFVTGRKHFQNVLRSYINNWLEHGLINNKNIRLHLFVAYDLKYQGTAVNDYKNIPSELAKMVDSISFLGTEKINKEIEYLKNENIINDSDAKLIFGEGYGKKRNVVSYFAIKNKMDRLIFIDDDEYPISTMKNDNNKLVWMGQSVVGTHLKYIDEADITHGHHCGYISPIPYIRFNEILTENIFKKFIDAISNDIISWEKIKNLIINHKGVTYADSAIINQSITEEVEEENGMKFISGANLCFNLKNKKQFPPFYNPVGARGEDTFLSTALSKFKILKVPCFTFHDGFSMYKNLLNGVLPLSLETIDSLSPATLKRFINATIGWIRYKPLLTYITKKDDYENIMTNIHQNLKETIPILCIFFNSKDFEKVLTEFIHYRKNVIRDYNDFEMTKRSWSKLMNSMS